MAIISIERPKSEPLKMKRMLDNIGKQAVKKYERDMKATLDEEFEEGHVFSKEEFLRIVGSSFACGYFCASGLNAFPAKRVH